MRSVKDKRTECFTLQRRVTSILLPAAEVLDAMRTVQDSKWQVFARNHVTEPSRPGLGKVTEGRLAEPRQIGVAEQWLRGSLVEVVGTIHRINFAV